MRPGKFKFFSAERTKVPAPVRPAADEFGRPGTSALAETENLPKGASHDRPEDAHPGYADQPGPDPAAFGLPAQDDGSRDDPLLRQNIVTCNAYRHDFDALRAASTRVVIGVGEKSGQGIAGRAGLAVAGRLGTTPVTFPGDHGGFLGGEYGQTGEPDAFAATLHQVLASLDVGYNSHACLLLPATLPVATGTAPGPGPDHCAGNGAEI